MHDDGKGQHNDGWHDDGHRRHDGGDGRHDDGNKQQGNRRHDDGDRRHDDAEKRRRQVIRLRGTMTATGGTMTARGCMVTGGTTKAMVDRTTATSGSMTPVWGQQWHKK